MSDHLWLDFDRVKDSSRINGNNATDYLWYYNCIAEMSLDSCWLLTNLALCLCLDNFLIHANIRGLDSTVHAASLPATKELIEFFV